MLAVQFIVREKTHLNCKIERSRLEIHCGGRPFLANYKKQLTKCEDGKKTIFVQQHSLVSQCACWVCLCQKRWKNKINWHTWRKYLKIKKPCSMTTSFLCAMKSLKIDQRWKEKNKTFYQKKGSPSSHSRCDLKKRGEKLALKICFLPYWKLKRK